jgi:hypothetical protein
MRHSRTVTSRIKITQAASRARRHLSDVEGSQVVESRANLFSTSRAERLGSIGNAASLKQLPRVPALPMFIKPRGTVPPVPSNTFFAHRRGISRISVSHRSRPRGRAKNAQRNSEFRSMPSADPDRLNLQPSRCMYRY